MAIALGGLTAPVMLGRGGAQRIADGIRQADSTRRSSQTAVYAELSQKVASQLGQAGVGQATPPSFGRVPGVRFQPPPGGTHRATGAAGRALADKTRMWSENLAPWSAASKQVGIIDVPTNKAAQAGIIDIPSNKAAQAGIIDIPTNQATEALARPLPALTARLESVGAMLGRIGEISGTMQDEMLRGFGYLRV